MHHAMHAEPVFGPYRTAQLCPLLAARAPALWNPDAMACSCHGDGTAPGLGVGGFCMEPNTGCQGCRTAAKLPKVRARQSAGLAWRRAVLSFGGGLVRQATSVISPEQHFHDHHMGSRSRLFIASLL